MLSSEVSDLKRRQQYYKQLCMSKYDQRMLKPRSNLLYFQLIPISINGNIKQLSNVHSLHLKLARGQQTFDETKKPIPIVNLINSIAISRVFLNFNISLSQDHTNLQFKLVILKGKNLYAQGCNQEEKRELEKEKYKIEKQEEQRRGHIGEVFIRADRYLQAFLKDDTKIFKEELKINNQMSLSFELYVEKTRFTLQKLVRSSIIPSKLKEDAGRVQKLQYPHNFLKASEQKNSPQSQKMSKERQPIIFISPFRSVQKNRKLIVRNSKTALKNNTTIVEEDSAAFSKSYNKLESPNKNASKQLLQLPQNIDPIETSHNQDMDFLQVSKSGNQHPSEIQMKIVNSEVDEDDPLNDISINECQSNGKDKMQDYVLNEEELDIKFTKSETDSKKTKPQQSKLKNKSKGVIQSKAVKVKGSNKRTSSNENIEKSQSCKKKDQKGLTLKSIGFYITFTIFSILLLYHIMTPSKKI